MPETALLSPPLVARCASPADVAGALDFAARRGLPVAIRGARPLPARPDGALVVDLSGLRSTRVDAAARSVVAGGGDVWADVDAATQAHGLAVTGARCPRAGVVGSVLDGGSGWLERAMGLTSDSLRAAEVVTPAGGTVRASRDEHPDLFWALHGGGANFGVVTSVELAIAPLGPLVPGGTLRFGPEAAGPALEAYAALMAGAPDVLCGGAVLDAAGLELVVLWAGEPRAAGPWLERLGGLGGDGLRTVRYTELQRLLVAAGTPLRGGFMRALDTGRALAAASRLAPGRAALVLQPLGGAFARFRDETALGHRDAAWAFRVLGRRTDLDHDGALRAAAETLATEAGTWPGLVADPGPARPGEAYGEAALRRLARIKRRWDPDNVLRHDHNIEPARG